MSKCKLQFLTALIAALFLYPLLAGGVQSEVEKDYYGKVIGQILDAETGEPVKEVFSVYIYESNNDTFPNNLYRYWDETDDRGKFQLDMLPFTFYLQFNPKSPTSKYCLTQYPYYLMEKDRDVIKVETGKITYFIKKIPLGGMIKIILADKNNVRFNPQEKFQQKFNIRTNVVGKDIYEGTVGGKDNLDDGVQTVYKLCAGIYRVEIKFEGLGFSNFKRPDIMVEEGKTTEVIVNLDLTDITGMEGYVTDAAGVPVEDSTVGFGVLEDTDDTIGYHAFTNKDGYYKLTGMPACKYYLTYYYNTTKRRLISHDYGYVEIKKNILNRLDLQFKMTIAEMEGQGK